MPFDSAGNFSLVPSYKAIPGQTIRTENHNPPLEDIANGMSAVLPRDGRAGMVGTLTMGGFGITNLKDGTTDTDAAAVGQIGTTYGTQIGAATTKATPVDADYMPVYDSAASNVLRKLTWANIKATLKTYFDTLYQATGTALLKSGGTMTGDLTLKGDPSTDLMAATKQYVDGGAIGVGQTWQDLTASRATDTVYQNTTGKPIEVAITAVSTNSTPRSAGVSADNVTWTTVGAFPPSSVAFITVSFIVPNGWYYKTVGALNSSSFWRELR